ncbi:MAG: hypothetical protein ABI304_13650 [Rudaea sp.]
MNMQALLIRATFMAMLAIGLSLAMIHERANKHSVEMMQRDAQTIAQPTTHASTAKTQHADAVIIMLPTIHVRAGVEQLTNTTSSDHDMTSSSNRIVGNEQSKLFETLRPSLHRLRLDMPYYSFGRAAMPRTSKE